MAHLQYMPGDPRLVDQLVYELKSKGIFDQFRKECIADVDTRPAYQNLRQRVENSVATFLSRQCWKPDLNKNQLREKLRKHILDGNYLEQGVERIVDQVVNPKVASVFIPQVEDLVYNYLGIARKKPQTVAPETSNGKINEGDLLPTDLEAVSPGSVKSNNDKPEPMDEIKDESMEIDIDEKIDKIEIKDDSSTTFETVEKDKIEQDTQLSGISELTIESSVSTEKIVIPASEELKLEHIPLPADSPPKIDLDKIQMPKDIPLPEGGPKPEEPFFKVKDLHSDNDDSTSSDSSLRRNMSPLTPIRNFNNENSCDAHQGYDNDSDNKSNDKKEPSTFRFALETKSPEKNFKSEKKETEQSALSFQFNTELNINNFNTPLYEDSSNSNNLQIDYESDINSKAAEIKPEAENSEDSKKDKKVEEKRSSHKSSHLSRDSRRHSSNKDKRSDSKHSSTRESSRSEKKSSRDEKSKTNRERERSKDGSDKKTSGDSSKQKSSYKSSSHRDSKSHKSSSSSRHSSKPDDRKDKSHRDRISDKSSDRSRDKRDSKSSSNKPDKDKRSMNKSDKEKKKDKKDHDDHYSVSGRGNHSRRSTDRDSNDGSTSSKGSNNHHNSKTAETKKESKSSTSKSDNTSTSGDSTSPSDKEVIVNAESQLITPQIKPVVRVDTQLEVPISSPPRLPFVPDVTLKKPKFAANLQEAKKMIKMRKFLDEEQRRMNQEAALLLEFQANVRPSLSQVYSSIPGPELEFACVSNTIPLESRVTYEIPLVSSNNIENVIQSNNIVNTIIYDVPIVSDNRTLIQSTDNNDSTDSRMEIGDEVLNNVDIACNEEQNTICANKNFTEDNSDNEIDTKPNETKAINMETYNENKPFSQLVDEITEYSKASEKLRNEKAKDSEEFNRTNILKDEDNRKRTELFEVTIITEELSENEDIERENAEIELPDDVKNLNEKPLHYFAEHEKYDSEIARHQYSALYKSCLVKNTLNKLHLINCDTYEENVIKDAAKALGEYEVINYYRNGHLKLTNEGRNIVKDVSLNEEVLLPVESNEFEKNSPVFSPVKSECSFELTSDYNARLEEMVNKTSRQEIMEIILGSFIEECQSEMPKIDYCTDVSLDEDYGPKRKLDIESTENNNGCILKSAKVRKLSDSDQISSTTEENDEEISNNNKINNVRSKYLGRARRVGLPRPRKNDLPNSPSSDKSVENYEQNTPSTPEPNGKIKNSQRKVQRYDTTDLYKPKLHYLSRRNNIT